MTARTASAICLSLVLFPIWGCSKGGSPDSQAVSTPSYYIDSASGSDSNSGLDASHPWKTLGHATTVSLSSGTMLYLKRGSVFHEQLTVPASGISIDAYGTGASPVIDGSTTLSSSWTNEGSGIYSQTVSLSSAQALGNITENGSLLNFVAWNADASTTLGGASTGSYSYDFSSSKIYIKPASAPSGNSYSVSVFLYGITADSKSDISINHITIQRFSLHGIQLKNCVRCSVSNTSISSGGGAVVGVNPSAPPTYLYAGNGIEVGNTSSGVTLSNITASDIFDSGISPQTYASNQTLSGITIQNATIDRCGFAGLEISVLSNGGSTGSLASNITASGLTITHSGQGWSGRRYGTEGNGIRIAADSGAGTLSGIQIQTSSVSGSAGDGIKIRGETSAVTLTRMSLFSNHYGINVTEPSATTLKLILTSSLIYSNSSYGIYFNAPSAAGFQLSQNTFYNNGTIHLAVFGQAGIATLLNNIFDSSSAMTDLYVSSTFSNPSVNYNCYTNLANMFGYNSSTYSTVGAFSLATGFEAQGVGGSVGMNNPSGGDFTLQSGSQCKNAGTALAGVNVDYSGAAFGNPPSSGAYQ